MCCKRHVVDWRVFGFILCMSGWLKNSSFCFCIFSPLHRIHRRIYKCMRNILWLRTPNTERLNDWTIEQSEVWSKQKHRSMRTWHAKHNQNIWKLRNFWEKKKKINNIKIFLCRPLDHHQCLQNMSHAFFFPSVYKLYIVY